MGHPAAQSLAIVADSALPCSYSWRDFARLSLLEEDALRLDPFEPTYPS